MTPKNLSRIINAASLLPLAYWAYLIFSDSLGADPAKTLNHKAGEIVFFYMLFNLMIGAFLGLSNKRPQIVRALIMSRRFLGVWTFILLCVHIFLYFAYEGFEAKAFEQLVTKTYLIFGFCAFWILLVMAATSNNFSVKRLGGKRWKNIHRSVYLASALFSVHILLIEKTDLIKFGSFIALLWLVQGVRFALFLKNRGKKPAPRAKTA